MVRFKINQHWIGEEDPTYFIADISANHDGRLDRAKDLIRLAKEAGADAAKFQHFRAAHIVSDKGFRELGKQVSHQAAWKKSVFEVYQAASLPWEWTAELEAHAKKVGIDFFSAPYDLEAVDMLDQYSPAYKIGSGDITWPEIIKKIALKKKPVLLATGASSMADVERAVSLLLDINPNLCLMQCNTNYTASLQNFDHIHLNVLKTFRSKFPQVILGLSDHTPGHTTVLGAVALGARVIEKHFTDDNRREGPDHPFSMNPNTWREMVDRTRELERALGSSDKMVAQNEQDTVVVQRRSLRAARNLKAGTLLCRDDINVLRPAPKDGIFPYQIDQVVGNRLLQDLESGSLLTWEGLESREKVQDPIPLKAR